MSDGPKRSSIHRPSFSTPHLDEELMREIEVETEYAELRNLNRSMRRKEGSEVESQPTLQKTSYAAELGIDALLQHQLFPVQSSPVRMASKQFAEREKIKSPSSHHRQHRKVGFNTEDANTSMNGSNTSLSQSASDFSDDEEIKSGHFSQDTRVFVRYDSSALINKLKTKRSFGVGDDDDEDHDLLFKDVNIRKRLRRALLSSNGGKVLDYLNAILSIASCVIYILETYYEYCEWFFYLRLLDLFLCFAFMVDYFMRLLLADSRWRYLTTRNALVDLLTISPAYYTLRTCLNHPAGANAEICSGMMESMGIGSRTLEENIEGVLRVMRTLRIFRVQRVFIYLESEINRKLCVLVLHLVALCLCTSSLMLFVESSQRLDFHDFFYFVIVTLSTVGYGDMNPNTDEGKAIVAFFIMFALFYIPKSTNSLLKLISMRSRYALVSYKPSPLIKHILLCGHVHPVVIRDFCNELFHMDHSGVAINVVILNKGNPSNELEHMLNSPKFSVSTMYIDGSPFFTRDLERAHADKATACFIFVDKWAEDAEAADAEAILMALSVKRFATARGTHDTLMCMQLMRTDSKIHYYVSRKKASKSPPVQMIIVHELKMNLLAKTCLVPGLTTMLGNLITSYDRSARPTGRVEEWFEEFEEGCEYELYRVRLVPEASGVKFCELAKLCYKLLNITVIALEIGSRSSPSRIVLNPGQLIIPDSSRYTLHAFVMSLDRTSASVISHESRATDGATSHVATSKRSVPETSRHSSGAKVAPANDSFASTGTVTLGSPTHRTKSAATSRTKRKYSNSPQGEEKVEEAGQVHRRIEREFGSALKELRSQTLAKRVLEKEGKTEEEELQATTLRQEIKGDLGASYYTTGAQTLASVTVQTSLIEELPLVRDHIIVTGNLDNLAPFVRPLRNEAIGKMQTILLLHTEPPSHATWQLIRRYTSVLYMFGSPLQKDDLRRAGVEYASCAVVLSKANGSLLQGGKGRTSVVRDQSLADADATFAHQSIMKLNPQIKIVTEITNQANVGFLDSHEEAQVRHMTQHNGHQFSVQYQAGRVFAASVLDTLLCQCFHNPQITTVFKLLVMGANPLTVRRWNNKNKSFPPIHESQLYQVPVPKSFTNKTFGELFAHMCDIHSIIPIAILRGVWTKFGHGGSGAVSPYVYTNPRYEAQLYSCDSVFVLSQSPPVEESVEGQSTPQTSLKMFDVTTGLRTKLHQSSQQKPELPTDYHLTSTFLDASQEDMDQQSIPEHTTSISSLPSVAEAEKDEQETNEERLKQIQAMEQLRSTYVNSASKLEALIRKKKQEIEVDEVLNKVETAL